MPVIIKGSLWEDINRKRFFFLLNLPYLASSLLLLHLLISSEFLQLSSLEARPTFPPTNVFLWWKMLWRSSAENRSTQTIKWFWGQAGFGD